MNYAQLIEETPLWLQRPFSEMRYTFSREGGQADITCRFFVHRREPFPAGSAFEHPAAVVTRIYLVAKGTSRVQVNGIWHQLHTGCFYLLPAGLPFNPCYGPCDLITRELHIYDSTGLPVLDPKLGIINLADEVLHSRTLAAMPSRVENTGGVVWLDLLAFETVLRFMEPRWETLIWKQKQSERFQTVIKAIRHSPTASIRIDDLAQTVGVSPGALSKGFQRALGVSLKDYILHILLNRAKELLVYTDLTVVQIAEMLGYENTAYFHRIFLRKIGLTPSAFRQSSRPNLQLQRAIVPKSRECE
jgi:AraC-like DNA-binding protein